MTIYTLEYHEQKINTIALDTKLYSIMNILKTKHAIYDNFKNIRLF